MSGQAIGDVAFGGGKLHGKAQARQQQNQYQLQQEMLEIRRQAQADAAMQAQMQFRAKQLELEQRQSQYEDLPQRQLELGRIENKLLDERSQLEFSHKQKQQMARINEAMDYVQRNPDGYYSPEEQQVLMRQLTESKHGIQPTQPKEPMPWPEEQGPGMIWEDGRGNLLTRDHNANVKVLQSQADQSLGPRDYFQLNKMVYDLAEQLYDQHQYDEQPLTREQAMRQAKDILGYDQVVPQQSEQDQVEDRQAIEQQKLLREVAQTVADYNLTARLDAYPKDQTRRQRRLWFDDNVVNNQAAKKQIRNLASVLQARHGIDRHQARSIAIDEYDKLKAQDTGRKQSYPNIDYNKIWTKQADEKQDELYEQLYPYLQYLSPDEYDAVKIVVDTGDEQQKKQLLEQLRAIYGTD